MNDQRHIPVAVGFPTATVFDVLGGVSVNTGVSFTLSVDVDKPLEWFADNDNVLDIKVSEDTRTATITALETGDSEIEIQFRKQTVKLIKITVVEAQATGFTVTVDNPIPK